MGDSVFDKTVSFCFDYEKLSAFSVQSPIIYVHWVVFGACYYFI